jgi:hypothetical protein
MRSAELKTRVVPALLSGTSRQPLRLEGTPLASAGSLAALSLAAQSLRFERQTAPTEFAIETHVRDERSILPDRLRKPMIRLLRTRRSTEAIELAIAWSFDQLKLRPHPFDLPRLGSFAKSHAEHLGPTAQVWAHRDTSAAQSTVIHDYFSTSEIDATNWTTAPPSRRAEFIVQQRRIDSTAGLELVRSVWANEDADVRVRLLTAIGTELKPTDKEFLDGLQKDRAPRVRDLAQRLLCRLPGATGNHPALAACLERIERTAAGILRHKTVLKLQLPTTVKDHQAKQWIRDTFAEVSCDELARALHLSETEMIEAAAKDSNLLLALALMATTDHRLDLLELVVRHLSEAWEAMAQCGPLQLETISSAERTSWAKILIRPYGGAPPFFFLGWSWMHRALRGPVPAAVMEPVLRSSQWREKLLETKGSDWTELLAACCPAEQRSQLRVLLGMIEPAQTVNALALMDILDGMEGLTK